MAQSAFPGTAPAASANNIDGGDDWIEYTPAQMLSGLDLVAIGGGRLARMIVVKASGSLYAVNQKGEQRLLTELPAGYIHVGKTRAIEPGQPVAIIVYW